MRRAGFLAAVAVGVTLAHAAATPSAAHAGSAPVAALQVALRAVGLSPGSIDGIAGPRTRRRLGRRGRPALGSRAMRIGQRGWDVAALQFLLSSRGFGPGGFDGGFGGNTAVAVRRFQRAAGLAADGVAGPSTLGALRHRQLSAGTPGGPVRFLRPIAGRITDGFGWIPPGRQHNGVDIPASSGTPVGAAGRGVVAFAGWNAGGYGNLVVVRHRLGFETWYAHLSSVAASVGQSVVGGSRIGYVGSTGHSTGPHLHFEVRHFGTPIDPVPRLLSAVAARVQSGRGRRHSCRPNADAWGTRDADPATARLDRCP